MRFCFNGVFIVAMDWIKMRTCLDSHPKVIAIAAQLNKPELHIVGCLFKVWSWADQHSIDGNAIRVTDVTLDRMVSLDGFSAALREVDWMTGRANAISFPRFDQHNGQTAKNRAETSLRVAKHRNAKPVTHVTQKPLPEKRREEKNISSNEDITPTPLVSEANPKPKKRTSFDPRTIGIPNELNHPGFIHDWNRWIEYRLQIGSKPLEASWMSQISKLARYGPQIASEAIRRSIENGWKGLFPESVEQKQFILQKPNALDVMSQWLERSHDDDERGVSNRHEFPSLTSAEGAR
jgi:hypothetical protein